MMGPDREKAATFWSQLPYQNAMSFVKLHANWTFFVPSFSQKKIQKNPDCQKTQTATKIGYFPKFGKFCDISVTPDSIRLICSFIYYFLLTNCRNKNTTCALNWYIIFVQI